MTATGIWLFPDATAPDLVNAFQTAESLGLDEVWLGDEGAANRDPFAVLAAAAIPVALYLNAVFAEDELEWARPRLVQALLDAPEVTRRRFGLDEGDLRAAVAGLADDDDQLARKLVTDEVVDHLVLVGNRRRVVRRICEIARAHQPASIGICLRTSTRPKVIEECGAVLAAARRELS